MLPPYASHAPRRSLRFCGHAERNEWVARHSGEKQEAALKEDKALYDTVMDLYEAAANKATADDLAADFEFRSAAKKFKKATEKARAFPFLAAARPLCRPLRHPRRAWHHRGTSPYVPSR